MVEWLLIVQLFVGGQHPPVQLGPFKSQAACEAAAKALQSGVVIGARYGCVPTDLPAR